MCELDDDIEHAQKDFNYYLRKRQKNLDNRKKFAYYDERLLIKEERLYRLLLKQKKQKNKKNKD